MNIGSRLIDSIATDLDSPLEWERAYRFFYKALCSVASQLPKAAQKELEQKVEGRRVEEHLTAARVSLWNSIKSDQMGYTPEGAAVRATIFLFAQAEENGPLDAIALFCSYYLRAGFPETVLVGAFYEQWPQNVA